MTQLDTVKNTPKSTMVSYTQNRNRQRVEEGDKEIEELMKKYAKEKQGVTEDEEENEEEETEGQEETDETSEEEGQNESEPKLSKEEETFKKRYSDLRRHLAKKEKEWEEEKESLASGQPKSFAVPKTREELEAWAKKYPDVAGIVESIAQQKAEEMFKRADSRLKEFDEITNETRRAKAEAAIRDMHSDFDKLRDSDKFHDWVGKQPKWIQDALYENEEDAASVIRVIDLYKADNGMTVRDKKKAAKDAASDVKTANNKPDVDVDESSKKIRESDVVKWSDEKFEKNYNKIIEAQKSGNFIYDITKK